MLEPTSKIYRPYEILFTYVVRDPLRSSLALAILVFLIKGAEQVSAASFSPRRTSRFFLMKTVYSRYAPSNELASSRVKLNFALEIPLICLPRASNVCQDCQPLSRTAGKTQVENCSFQTPLGYKIGRFYRASSLRRKVIGLIFNDVRR